MSTFIPYGKQSICEEDVKAVLETLHSDWLTCGPAVSQFEAAISSYCGAQHAIAVSNGTAALHLACLALDVKEGDVVWTSPNTFLASANCALFCGASVDFVDIDPVTYNMSAERLEEKLKAAKQVGKLPKVVIPVDFAGQSCDMQKMRSLADEYGFYIIEDACHALGGKYQNKPIGSCQYADMTIFSFHPVKVITTAEGGAITTNDKKISQKLQLLRAHGMTRDESLMTEEPHGPWFYEQCALGYNYRISDLQCALGISQMRKLDEFIAKRNMIAKKYDELLSGLPLVLPKVLDGNYSAFHLYVVQVDPSKTDKTRLSLFNYLRENNIGANVHYIPVHTQPVYRDRFGFKKGDFPEAESYYKHVISLPIFPLMEDKEVSIVCSVLQGAFT